MRLSLDHIKLCNNSNERMNRMNEHNCVALECSWITALLHVQVVLPACFITISSSTSHHNSAFRMRNSKYYSKYDTINIQFTFLFHVVTNIIYSTTSNIRFHHHVNMTQIWQFNFNDKIINLNQENS